MNRIEQVVAMAPAPAPAPAQQPQPCLPRARRRTAGLAVAIATLAVPLLPGQAFGDTSAPGAGVNAAKTTNVAENQAAHAWHHRHHGHGVPGPGAMTVQALAAGGWTFAVPGSPAEPGLMGHVMAMRHHGHHVPWLGEPVHAARSRGVPDPLITTRTPADTKQMLGGAKPDVDIPQGTAVGGAPASRLGVVAADSSPSSCQRAADPVGTDRDMLAHLRPAADPMDVVVTPHRTACAARVDYLSQARA